jgi:hypothetical protein
MKLFLVFIILNFGISQDFDKSLFIQQVRNNYHTFSPDSGKNIESYLNSLSFSKLIASKTSKDLGFPIKINWKSSFDISIEKETTLSDPDVLSAQENLSLMAGFFIKNWLQFSVNNIVPTSVINPSLSHKNKRVYFSHILQYGNKFDHVSKEFALNGLLLKSVIQTSDKYTITIQPMYTIIKDKWLCTGWYYKKSDKNSKEIETIQVELFQKFIDGNFYPYDAYLKVSGQEEPNIVSEQLYFRNFN